MSWWEGHCVGTPNSCAVSSDGGAPGDRWRPECDVGYAALREGRPGEQTPNRRPALPISARAIVVGIVLGASLVLLLVAPALGEPTVSNPIAPQHTPTALRDGAALDAR